MISPERSHELLSEYAATRCGTAFRELVAGWTGMVYGTALRVARGEEALAEDVTQIVFSRLAAAPEKVRDARALGPWLHAAATGLTLDALRSEARRRRREETSRHVLMPEPEPAGPHAGEDWLGLALELDGALGRLPPRDSQLLMMRFWQQQDWRSIGRNLGLSDDAAQKRMSRALDRLRHILARRGITGTAGVLPNMLAGMVPPDLPAAVIQKIIIASQAPATLSLTAVVMTTKTKATIAGAIVIAAAAPMFYQQRRIEALRGEIESLRQKSSASPFSKPLMAVFAEKENAAAAVPFKHQDGSGSSPPERSDVSGPMTAKGESTNVDLDALNRGKMKEKLAVLRNRLSLTPEQERGIAGVLEYAQSKMRVLSPPNVIFQRATPHDDHLVEDAIGAYLTPDQQKEYESFRAEEKANALEAAANHELSNLQSMVTLSQEQKDQAFAVFSDIASREAALPVLDPDREADAIRAAEKTRWADRQEALSAILTPEQMALYQQVGNPFRRGFGG